MAGLKERIIGKYAVITTKTSGRGAQESTILTDNPIEAIWEANRLPNRVIQNICGEREFYKDENGKYKLVKQNG